MHIRRPRPPRPDARPYVNPHAAGWDIGSEEIWACVPEDRDPQPVRAFGTFTPDLYTLAAWLHACRVGLPGETEKFWALARPSVTHYTGVSHLPLLATS
jgi:hypothetical protein